MSKHATIVKKFEVTGVVTNIEWTLLHRFALHLHPYIVQLTQ